MKSKRVTIVALAALALLVGTAGAENVTPTAAVIYGCQSTKGEVKIVSQSTLCSSLNSKQSGTWTVLNWNGTGIQGATGAQGIQGVKGDTGDPGTDGTNGTDGVDGTDGTNGTNGTNGVSGYENVFASYIVASQVGVNGAASCPAGKKVLGGGFDADGLNVSASSPYSNGLGWYWYVSAYNPNATTRTLTVFAVCATVS
jgi:hypothetical protein